LTGVDIQKERIDEAKRRFPNVNFVHCDAAKMQFQDETFDIVTESTMFVQLTDDNLAHSIASEMIRVTKTGGYIMLVDWRYSKPWDKKHYKGLSIRRIKDLFSVPSKTIIFSVFNGALIPSIGRFFSKRIPSLYFLVQTIFPFLVGQKTTILKKI
jgi:ubiquinone/menaquinone biosynthesis C-methylase UbiE